ncbi:MAG: ABC transporter permease [Firmicutes bacterium]|nr:ABC transporter permease [Alicyclobacillaceae bacterium]MCL6497083.1 ABC transporter permease [Bacillota bacterium]
MIALRGIYVIWLRELIRFVREPARIVGMVAQPLLYLILVGNGLAHGFQFRGAGSVNYLAFMFPGIVAMSVLFTSVFSAMSIVWDREFGFLKEVLVSPVPRAAIAIGKALGGTTVAVAQGAVILILSPLVGIALEPGRYLAMLGVLALLALALNGLGILVASRMESMQGFQVVMNFLVMPLFFLSGALYPLRGMPGWLAALMQIDPVTYGVDALRHLVYFRSALLATITQFSLAEDLAVTLGTAALLLVVSTVAFNRTRSA